MSIKKNKNLIGNIVIIISIIIVILTAYMIYSSQMEEMYSTDDVIWNGMDIILFEGLTVDEQTDDVLKLSGRYGINKVEIKKTTDLTRYNKLIGDTDGLDHIEYEFNDTHTVMATSDNTYCAVVPNDALESSSDSVFDTDNLKLKGNPVIYEFTCDNGEFLVSFMGSITQAKDSSGGGVEYE